MRANIETESNPMGPFYVQRIRLYIFSIPAVLPTICVPHSASVELRLSRPGVNPTLIYPPFHYRG